MQIELMESYWAIDWPDQKKRVIETDDFEYFVMQCRGNVTEWYLMHYAKSEDGNISNVYVNDFQLSDPADAVIKLGSKIKRFEHLHSRTVVEQLSWLMDRVLQKQI